MVKAICTNGLLCIGFYCFIFYVIANICYAALAQALRNWARSRPGAWQAARNRCLLKLGLVRWHTSAMRCARITRSCGSVKGVSLITVAIAWKSLRVISFLSGLLFYMYYLMFSLKSQLSFSFLSLASILFLVLLGCSRAFGAATLAIGLGELGIADAGFLFAGIVLFLSVFLLCHLISP